MNESLSIILPAKNEAANLPSLLAELKALYPAAEILVVDDGSTDQTGEVGREYGARVVRHPYSLGNGAAVKTGARNARGDLLVFMDADGQHAPADIARLLAKLEEGYEMVVGARQADTHASPGRRLANHFYNRLASVMTGYRIEDLTSGFRTVRARHFRKFLYLLPNGFSYPTTSTMAFFRSGFPVAYIPIRAGQRGGKSHIRLLRDGARFFLIILKVGALFSPMRFFLPLSLVFFLTAVSYYGYTYATLHRFTNMSAVLLIYSLSLFLIGLVSEQISALHYKGVEDDQRRTRWDERRRLAASFPKNTATGEEVAAGFPSSPSREEGGDKR
ncbi:MAG: glycosyltransferase family 2 protein [Candidatus Competibacteraceae bacterium]|nr:MAG: glycosyltransferase family 2 protein [Candidatus Competibacteraceae bacterium]